MKIVTVESYSGDIVALDLNDNYLDAINSGDTACWVWQEVESKVDALMCHLAKFDEWERDNNNGFEKEYY